jgi:hypothetical protein
MEMAENIQLFRPSVRFFRTEDRKSCMKRYSDQSYITDAYPGQKDPPEIQLLKGMAREWEGASAGEHLNGSLQIPIYGLAL